ncbi:MAG: hypothetical protein WDN04_13995 [Rhodospirillales bacterium]
MELAPLDGERFRQVAAGGDEPLMREDQLIVRALRAVGRIAQLVEIVRAGLRLRAVDGKGQTGDVEIEGHAAELAGV